MLPYHIVPQPWDQQFTSLQNHGAPLVEINIHCEVILHSRDDARDKLEEEEKVPGNGMQRNNGKLREVQDRGVL